MTTEQLEALNKEQLQDEYKKATGEDAPDKATKAQLIVRIKEEYEKQPPTSGQLSQAPAATQPAPAATDIEMIHEGERVVLPKAVWDNLPANMKKEYSPVTPKEIEHGESN